MFFMLPFNIDVLLVGNLMGFGALLAGNGRTPMRIIVREN